MIAVGQQYRYIAWRGKLARRCNQTVTALHCQRHQILVRFPDGLEAYVHPRFLRKLTKSLRHDAIESHIDLDALEETKQQEARDRAAIDDLLSTA